MDADAGRDELQLIRASHRSRIRRRPETPGGYVGQAVLEKRGGLMRRVIAQRLEGSRFGVYLATLADFVSSQVVPKRAKTGGSRERFDA